MDVNQSAVSGIAGLFPMIMLFDTHVDEGEEFVRVALFSFISIPVTAVVNRPHCPAALMSIVFFFSMPPPLAVHFPSH
jgi:hypothetical protein